jgi:hypothetical protein
VKAIRREIQARLEYFNSSANIELCSRWDYYLCINSAVGHSNKLEVCEVSCVPMAFCIGGFFWSQAPSVLCYFLFLYTRVVGYFVILLSFLH